jgi:hypothetical protein
MYKILVGSRKTWVGMNWIVVVQDTDRWRALENRVMNLGVPQNFGSS